MTKKPWPVYPLLFTVALVASSVAVFGGSVSPAQVLRPLLLGVMGVALALALASAIWRDRPTAGVATLAAALLVLCSGTAVSSMRGLLPVLGPLAGLLLYAALMTLLTIAFAYYARRRPGSGERLTRLLNVFMAAITAVPLVNFGRAYVTLPGSARASVPTVTLAPDLTPGTNGVRPDIYYIIVDGFARADVLASVYGVDAGPFLQELRDMGFYVATESRSNYTQTMLSLASSLNLNYLDGLVDVVGVESKDRAILGELVKHSALRRFLEAEGYTTVAFASAFYGTDITDVDHYMRPSNGGLTLPESLLLSASLASALGDAVPALRRAYLEAGHAAHRDRIRLTLETLPSVALMDGPLFVFAHIAAPHPPFVFGPEGQPVTPEREMSFCDGSHYAGEPEEYTSGYRAQVSYLSAVLPGVLREILKQSRRPVAIILQADHGPGSRLDWESLDTEGLDERTAILNAYYLPCPDAKLYPSISPVNTFRVVLNSCLGVAVPLLPDESYHATWERPYDLILVPDGDR